MIEQIKTDAMMANEEFLKNEEMLAAIRALKGEAEVQRLMQSLADAPTTDEYNSRLGKFFEQL